MGLAYEKNRGFVRGFFLLWIRDTNRLDPASCQVTLPL